MNQASTASPNSSFPRGAGYLYFVGVLQIALGLLSVVFSLFAFLHLSSAGVLSILDPQKIQEQYAGPGGDGWNNLIAAYASLQAGFGWIFGVLLIAAGICCLKRRCRKFVWFSTVVNLLNMPHGTTVALLTWHGLTRPRISEAFSDPRE